MKSINLLLASSERRLSSLIEAAVRDACYGQVLVECTRCSQLDELIWRGRSGWLDLIVVAPNSLLPAFNRRWGQVTLEQLTEAVRAIKSQCLIPMLAVNVPAEEQMTLLEAGVDNAFGFPLDLEALKHEVRQGLHLPEPVEAGEPASGWSLLSLLLHGWHRPRSA